MIVLQLTYLPPGGFNNTAIRFACMVLIQCLYFLSEIDG